MDGTDFSTTYWNDGYVVVNGLISDEKINAFIKKHKPNNLILEEKLPLYQSYISRDAYIDSQEIRDILCGTEILHYFKTLNKQFALHLSEARIGTSGIKWHTDYIDQLIDAANNYIGVHVAMSDVDIECGPFELIPGSHKWVKNAEILNHENCKNYHNSCYEYNEKLIDSMGVKPYVFEAKKGDVLFWHGHLYHRGGEIKNWKVGRDVLFGHYYAIEQYEAQSCIDELPGQRIKNNNGIFYVVGNYHD
jgi:ectoine hydroxylase-related dioxygenase (phytanoyl-CoA dioxygenase family)